MIFIIACIVSLLIRTIIMALIFGCAGLVVTGLLYYFSHAIMRSRPLINEVKKALA